MAALAPVEEVEVDVDGLAVAPESRPAGAPISSTYSARLALLARARSTAPPGSGATHTSGSTRVTVTSPTAPSRPAGSHSAAIRWVSDSYDAPS